MTNAEVKKELEKYPEDMIVCGSGEWEYKMSHVEKRTFDDHTWEKVNKDVIGKECIFIT